MAKKAAVAETAAKTAGADKKAAIETVISRIERECGKGSIMRLGENSAMNVSAVSQDRSRSTLRSEWAESPRVE